MESSVLVEKAEEWCVPLANHPRAGRTGAPRTPMSNRLDSDLKAAEGDLPTMPASANQVVQAVDNPDSAIDDIRVLIDQDAAIAARVFSRSRIRRCTASRARFRACPTRSRCSGQ